MRKKNYAQNSEEENEFDVDEPEAIQNNASDDDWTPDKAEAGGRRTSTRLRNIPKSRAPIIDASSTDEEGSEFESSNKRKGKGKGRTPPAKKAKVSSSSTPKSPKGKTETISTPSKSVSSDSEPSSTTAVNNSTSNTPTIVKVNKDFSSGAFIVLKTDVAKLEEDPPLWKIDGKALLQKYIPFEQDGQTLYKNTSVYSGWTLNNKNNYFPVTVIFKQQTRKDHIVEFKRDQIKLEDLEKVRKEAENDNKNGNDKEVHGIEEDEDDMDDEENEEEEEENEDEENEEDEDGEDNEEGLEDEKNGNENGDSEEVEVKPEINTVKNEDAEEVKKEKE